MDVYAAGLVELEYGQFQCPCSSVPGAQPPSFVGSDYYCESGLYQWPTSAGLYASDTLWDGQRCDGYEGPCCSHPNLPWFCKELSEPTTDDLEVRLCADQDKSNEDAPIELVELYSRLLPSYIVNKFSVFKHLHYRSIAFL